MSAEPDTYSYTRYLEAKRSVDDRALHPRVWERFIKELEDRSPLRIFEMGGGVGSTALRIIDALQTRSVETIEYEMMDLRPGNIDAARQRLSDWGRENGFDVYGANDRVVLQGSELDVSVLLRVGDALADDHTPTQAYDAIVAQAVLDIVPVASTLSRFAAWSNEGALWYFPIHFNGVTAFEPVLDSALDAQIERLYHESMNDGEGGGAQTGRHLLQHIKDAGARLVDAGGSDWIVSSRSKKGKYPHEEKYFLYHILSFINKEMQRRPEIQSSRYEEWLSARKEQIRKGELTFLAHNIDVLGTR